MRDTNSVLVLDKALHILTMFRAETREWSVTELALSTGMPKSTTYRLLRALVRHELLAQDQKTRRFQLGLGALALGRRAYESLELRRRALPVLNQMAALSGETVLLVALNQEHDRSVCVERAPRQSTLHLLFEVGAMGALHASAPSKVLLAYLPEQQIEAIIARGLPAFTEHTIIDPDELRADLANIRSGGYAVSFEETDKGVAGVSVPLHGADGKVVASLGVSGPITRMNQSTIQKHIALAREGARLIERESGYVPGTQPPGRAVNERAKQLTA
jgi:IclR family transcriptional regulator, KDG regulon repressor